MSFSVTDAFVQQFSGNVKYLAQQTKARLRPTLHEEPITGEAAYIEQVAPTAARKVQARHADSPVMNTQHLRRRVAPYDYDWGDLIDKEDKFRLLIDPTSTYANAAAYALERGIDDEIIGAMFATSYTGHNGTTAVAWPNGNGESAPAQPGGTVVAVNDWSYGVGAGNAGLTVSKLISASVALDAAEGDEDEERYIVVTAKQKGNLLATTEATSTDYNTVRALVDGKIDTFMGFKFIHSERLQQDSNNYWRIPAYRKTALGLGIASDIWSKMAERSDKRFSMYVYAAMSLGAARLEESKMVEIKCQ